MKITLRACAYPLMPAHLAIFLKDQQRSGMEQNADIGMTAGYHQVAVDALEQDIAASSVFAEAIKNAVFGPTNKSLSKLSPRNQFLALAPRLDFANVLVSTNGEILRPEGDDINVALIQKGEKPIAALEIERILGTLMSRPFVMGYDLFPILDELRVAGDNQFAVNKLHGFVEQHAGASCIFTYNK